MIRKISMLDSYVHLDSLLIGAIVAALPLMIGLLSQRSSFRKTSVIREAELARLRQTAAVGAEEIREAKAQHGRALQVLREGHAANNDEQRRSHAAELQLLEAAHVKALEEARTELSIVSFPYESTTGDDGWIIDDRISEIGYQYQLFLRGVPCFSPHKVITQRIEKKEVNQQKIAGLKDEVAGLLATIASRHPAFQVAQKFVTGAKSSAH